MNKRKIFLLAIIFLSAALFNQVRSYTMAAIEGSTDVNISSSEDALIAVPENIKVTIEKNIKNTITKTITDIGEDENIETNITNRLIYDNFYITDNMNETIDVSIIKTDNYKGLALKNNHNISIFSGETWNSLSYIMDDDVLGGKMNIQIAAKWNGGKATIDKAVNVEVNVKTEDVVVTNDIRTKTEQINNAAESKEIKEIKEIKEDNIPSDNNQ